MIYKTAEDIHELYGLAAEKLAAGIPPATLRRLAKVLGKDSINYHAASKIKDVSRAQLREVHSLLGRKARKAREAAAGSSRTSPGWRPPGVTPDPDRHKWYPGRW